MTPLLPPWLGRVLSVICSRPTSLPNDWLPLALLITVRIASVLTAVEGMEGLEAFGFSLGYLLFA